MEKEDIISVQRAQEDVETSYNLLNNNNNIYIYIYISVCVCVCVCVCKFLDVSRNPEACCVDTWMGNTAERSGICFDLIEFAFDSHSD